ncbi:MULTISPECIES: helix-turn-helix domain-containing protein [unclassified Pseudomonas]|uniref:winged helix-turn-helix transcriptional regulator n=1 Tax=unclassified Pseudomonas TaxID=196821 RepID=UPI0005345603|nr:MULTISPECIES: helix-turn-helix domain-containing protein [unclassified Pseudomonas]
MNVETLQDSEKICKTLNEEDDGLRREILAHAGSRWSLGILHFLGVYGRMRHAEIGRQMVGVTQRMLTRTLRSLERDGLVSRYIQETFPPKVEYELTLLGKELLIKMTPIWTWVVEHVDDFREARRKFDIEGGELPPWQSAGADE